MSTVESTTMTAAPTTTTVTTTTFQPIVDTLKIICGTSDVINDHDDLHLTAAMTENNVLNNNPQSIIDTSIVYFTFWDYGFFVAVLSLSALIGIYYGYFSKHKQNTTSEYILGGRSLNILPVATSLIAT